MVRPPTRFPTATRSPMASPAIWRSSPRCTSSDPVSLEQEHAGRRATTRGHHGSPGVRHLTVAGVAAQLDDRFADEPEAVRPPLGELAAVRVHRELAVESDPPAAIEPILGLAETP